MRKKDLLALIQPLLPRFHALGLCLLPDDLQAQQLVIDALTLCLLKEKKQWREREWIEDNKKTQLHLRRLFMKSMVGHMVDLGVKRASQLWATLPDVEIVRDHPQFYQLETRTRAVAWLRFNQGWNMDEIERVLGLKRFELVEKIHNARFLMLSQPPLWKRKAVEANA